jgi:pyruvate/2-oxoglutarate dehydrogenase complex dihydrolipoamide dehydrogenase (E3) component
VKVNVFVTNISGERLWAVEKDLPSQIQIAVNINILGIEEQSDGSLQSPFVFTVNFTPAIAQISIKGRARIQGETSEMQKILQEQKEQKVPSGQIIQAISSTAIAEAILISKTLGIPPPLPPLPTGPAAQAPTKIDSRYTA